MGFFLLLKEKVVCVHNRVNPLTLTPTIKADLVHFNARSAAFCSNIMNVHHFSSLCSVSWLLMSGYLSYPRENPSLSLFRELSNPSVIEETGEHSRVFQAFKVSCLKTLSLYLLFKLTSICHNLIACVSSRLRKEIYGVITLCLKGSYLCDPPPSQIMFVQDMVPHQPERWNLSQNTHKTPQRVFTVFLFLWDNQIRVKCGVDDGGCWWTLSLLCHHFF